jgi:hypothetical protein
MMGVQNDLRKDTAWLLIRKNCDWAISIAVFVNVIVE